MLSVFGAAAGKRASEKPPPPPSLPIVQQEPIAFTLGAPAAYTGTRSEQSRYEIISSRSAPRSKPITPSQSRVHSTNANLACLFRGPDASGAQKKYDDICPPRCCCFQWSRAERLMCRIISTARRSGASLVLRDVGDSPQRNKESSCVEPTHCTLNVFVGGKKCKKNKIKKNIHARCATNSGTPPTRRCN